MVIVTLMEYFQANVQNWAILKNHVFYYFLQIGGTRVHFVRTRGGNRKFRALRIDSGNFAWASEGTARKTRIIDVVYNASNNELVRTKTLVKNAIIVIDATPFKQWYESHYLLPLGRKREAKPGEEDPLSKKRSQKAMKKYLVRQKTAALEPALEEQFTAGRLLGKFYFNLSFYKNLRLKMMIKTKATHKYGLL